MTHSWLFTGPPGSGRSVAAKKFAAELVCGCGQPDCWACNAVASDSHPDVRHVVPQELSISVEAVRDIIADASKMPSQAPWRVVIIEDADRLTESAANALLKTVEEPPERTVIILCAPSTDPADIAITLRSRCRHVYVPTPPTADIAALLEAEGFPAAHAQLAAAASAGHIGRARHLVSNKDAQARRARVLGLPALIYQGDRAFVEVGELAKVIEQGAKEELAQRNERELEKLKNALGMGGRGKGTQKVPRGELSDLETRQKRRTTRYIRDALDLALIDLSGLYRDAMMQSLGADAPLIHPDFSSTSAELARRNSPAALLQCLEAIALAREAFGQNVAPKIALNAMVGRIRLACGAM